MPNGSGASSYRLIEFSNKFDLALLVNVALCISSGVRRIWPSQKHPGGIPHLPDWVTREAYSEEVSSCGFWPGGGPIPYAAFYSYAYPAPPDFLAAFVRPNEAFFSNHLHEFLLSYDMVREAAWPDDTLLEFLQTT